MRLYFMKNTKISIETLIITTTSTTWKSVHKCDYGDDHMVYLFFFIEIIVDENISSVERERSVATFNSVCRWMLIYILNKLYTN